MYKEYSEKLYQNFIINDFVRINSKNSPVLSNDTPNITLEKSVGPNLYLVIIHNCDAYTIEDALEYTRSVNIHTQALSRLHTFKQVIICNLLIHCNTNDSISKVLQHTNSNFDSYVYNIFWDIQVSDSLNIQYGKNQPTKVLNIQEILTTSYANLQKDKANQATSQQNVLFEDITTNAKSLQPLQIQSRDSTLTVLLLFINFTFFLMTSILGDQLIINYSCSYESVIVRHEYYRLLTSMFVHKNVFHLLANSIGLYVFAYRIERYMGKIQLFSIFMLGGVVGNLATVYLTDYTTIGASGGVYALMGFMLTVLYLYRQSIEGLTAATVLIFVVFGLIFGSTDPLINNYAHIGGLLTGMLIGVNYKPRVVEKG